MTKIVKPETEVSVCDVCHRETGYLSKCLVCGGEYCISCEAILAGCMMSMRVCRTCSKRDDVDAVSKKFAPRFVRIKNKRMAELKALPKLKGE